MEDSSGYLNSNDSYHLASHLHSMYHESGVDVRFIFLRETPLDLASYALRRARQLRIGRDVDRRSMLFVYDIPGARMRVEVGPGLEGIFPDGFVGYLMREQTAAFFAAGSPILGLKSTLFIVNFRLREAALEETYDPRKISWITHAERLAAGAGATARAPIGHNDAGLLPGAHTADAVARFGPQPTVAAVRERYLEALHDGYLQPGLQLYAPGTESALRAFPMIAPYAQFILYSEYGHKYRIVERGNLAILYYTTTPFVSAHLFRRAAAGWQLDLAAEVRDTREDIGGELTWEMRLTGDDYSRTFADLFENFDGLLRPRDGDNRRLPIHGRLQ